MASGTDTERSSTESLSECEEESGSEKGDSSGLSEGKY